MNYLIDVLRKRSSPQAVECAFEKYRAYLDSVKDSLPASAYAFASAAWHYDYRDHRCPHDSWVESLVVREISAGKRQEIRNVEIVIRVLGAFHNGHLEFTYPAVCSYCLTNKGSSDRLGHVDWLTDEVRLSDSKKVLHEIVFSAGHTWLIESADIQCRWIPKS